MQYRMESTFVVPYMILKLEQRRKKNLLDMSQFYCNFKCIIFQIFYVSEIKYEGSE